MAKDIPNPDDYFGPSSSKAGKPAPNPDDYFGPVQSAAPAKPEAPGVLDRARDAIVQAATSVVPSAQQLSDARDTTANMAAGAVRAGMQLFGQAKPEEPKTVMGVDSTAKAGGPTATVPAQDGGAPYDQNLFASIKRGIESGDIDPNDPRLSPVGRRLAQRIASQSGISGPVHDATGPDDRLKRMQDHMPAGQGTPPRDSMRASEPQSLLSRVLDKTVRKPMDNSLAGAALETAGDAVRGSVRGLNAVEQGLWGGVQAASDIAFGGDSAASRLASASARAASANMDEIASPDRNSLTQQVFESTFMNVPVLLGFGAGNKALAAMGSLSAGQAYHEARQAGLQPDQALERAAWNGTAGILGEKLSLPTLGKMFSQAAAKVSNKELGHVLADLLVKEQAGEQLTTALQDAYDKFGRGGTRHNMTVGEYLDDVVNTAKVTLGQSLLMGGAAHVVRAAMPASAAAPGLVAQNYDKLFGDSPATSEDAHRVQVLGVVDRLAKQHGLAPDALAAIKEQSANVPAADLAAWADRAMLAMAKRGMMRRPGDLLTPQEAQANADATQADAMAAWKGLSSAGQTDGAEQQRVVQQATEQVQPSAGEASAQSELDAGATGMADALDAESLLGDSNHTQQAEPISDAVIAGANSSPDLSNGNPLPVQRDGFINVPGDFAKRHGLDSPTLKGLEQIRVGGSNGSGGILSSDTAGDKGYSSLDVPTQARVLKSVLSLIHDDKIFGSVVHSIPVEVMNQLTGEKFSADQAFNNSAVLVHALSTNRDLSVVGRAIDALIRSPAFPVAEGSSEYLRSRLENKSGAEGALQGDGHESATSQHNDTPLPSIEQQRAGNYKKGHISFQGLDVSIENPANSIRTGIGHDGTPWATRMQHAYGYIKGTIGNDKDHVDTFIGSNPDSQRAFVVDQIDPHTGKFDEHKIVLGADSIDQAREIYQANYAPDWRGLGAITEMPVPEFKAWVKDGPKTKPLGDISSQAKQVDASASESQTDDLTSRVFKTRRQAERARNEIGNTHRLQKVKGGYKLRPFTDKEREAAAKAGERLKSGKVNVNRHSLLDAISKIGGIAMSERADTITEGNRNVAGGMLFRNEGLPLDILAQRLDEIGYIPPQEYESDGGVSWLRNAIGEEFGGIRKHFSMSGDEWMRKLQQEALGDAPDYDAHGITHSEIEASGYLDEDEETQRAIDAIVDAALELQDQHAAQAEDDFWHSLSQIEQEEEDHAKQEAERGAVDSEAGLRDRGAEVAHAGKEGASDRGGQEVGRGAEQGQGSEQGLTLEAQTEQDLREKALREEAAASAEKKQRDAEQERLRKKQTDLEAKQRADSTVDDFQLGQSADQQLSGMGDMFADEAPQASAPAQPAAPANTKIEAGDSDEMRKAKADAMKALGDLADIFGKGSKLNMMPEQEQKLLPVLTRLFDAAFRMGYLKFKDAARFALDQIRNALGDAVAAQITLQHLQGAFVGASGRYISSGADSIITVASFTSLADLASTADGGVEANPTEVGSDSLVANPDTLTNLPHAQAGSVKRDGSIDIDALRRMNTLMVSVAQDKEILRSIVRSIPIDVVNMLGGEQGASKRLLSDKPVLIDLATSGGDGDESITSRIKAARAIVKAVAPFATEAARTAAQKTVAADDIRSALDALEHSHVNIVGDRNAPSTDPNLERNRRDAKPAAPGMGQAVRDEGRGDDAGSEPNRGRPVSEGRGQPNDSGVAADGTAAAGERRDQPVRDGGPTAGPSLDPARADDGERSGDLGIGRVPPDTIPAKSIGEAATTIPEDAAKRNAQRAADQVAVKLADLANIKETLPYLLEGQQEDVFKAEKRFAKPDGYGILFTNGTGTGKTFTGLGIAKRFARQGKTNILIVTPDEKVLTDWIESGRALGLSISQLADTKDAGKGIVVTTYANLGANDALATRKWDLVIPDEAHKLSQEKDGTHTSYLKNLRAITLHPDGLTQRFTMLNRPAIEELAELSKSIDSKRKLADADDTMDVMRAAILKEVEKLEALYIKASGKLDEKRQQNREEVLGSQGAARTRVAMLSATPFAYEQSIDLAEGYLFSFDEGQPADGASGTGSRPYNSGSNRDRFFMQHFGYRMRHNRLTRPDAEVDSGLMQRQFNTWLKSQGVLSARTLDVPFDYDRRFILVDSAIGNRIDEALQWISDKAQAFREAQRGNDSRASNGYDVLSSYVSEKFDYQSRRYLLEAIKASEVIRHVREHMKLGRKVVVFHDYKKGGGFNPFNVPSSYNPQTAEGLPDPAAAEAYKSAAAEFRAEFKDLVESNLGKMQSPIEVFSKEFPDVLLINGDQKKADLLERYKRFNDDATGPMVALVQSAKNAGWSGHDTTGKHQRVLFNLGQPTAPTMAIQQEGRIYRTGQASDAIFRYLNTGTNWERWAFASTIAHRSSVAENLGMGEQARNLKDAFISAFEESGDFPAGHEGEGTGGKERDKAQNAVLTDFERAKTFYFGTQKKDSRTKAQEGKDYFATPEPIGMKMVEWSDVRGGESGLEPSGGHGAIARWMPENVNRVAIEPSAALRSRLALVFDGKILGEQFEDHNIVNKYDVITMNPPFGVGGKTAIDHLSKAAGHLNDGGRIVAIIPTGPAADKRFESWFYGEERRPAKPLGETARAGKFYVGDTVEIDGANGQFVIQSRSTEGHVMLRPADGDSKQVIGYRSHYIARVVKQGDRTESFKPAEGLYLVADIALPSVAFERAGTSVMTRVVIIDKGQPPAGGAKKIDLKDADSIKDLFDRIEHLSITKRAKAAAADGAAQASGRQATIQAKAEAAKQAASDGAKLAEQSGMDLVEHVTGKGNLLKGVVRTDLTKDQAQAIDKFTFKKNGGWFIRDKHIAELQEKFPVTGGVAQEPPATYHAGTYETDLFGHPVPAAARARRAAAAVEPATNRDVQRAGELRDTEAPAGDYIVRTTVGFTEQRKLGASIVKTASQAAAATQYLYKSPVERFDAIVTDAQHKPLAVVGGFKGAISQTSVYPATVVAEAIRIDGAAHIWLSHNHPSGIANLSRADINLWGAIRDVLRGSGIEPMGLIAVGNGRFGYVERDGSQGDLTMDRDGAHGSATVPVVERELLSQDSDRQVVDSPSVSKQLAHDFYQQSRSPGMILLDAQLRVSAWVPLPKNTLGALRDTGGMNALYRAVSEANAASVILVHGGELDERGNLPGHITVGQNIGAALNKLDVRVVDSINAGSKPMKSAAERGDDLHAGPVFSLKPGAWYRSELQTQVEKSPMNAGQPVAWRQYLDALSKRGAVKADEIEWTGLREWLELQTGKVTKDQILDYLDSNGVQVSEEVLGGEPNHVDQDTGEEFPTSQTENPPKYGSYTLPGGENYRELVLTLPTKKSLPDGFTLKQITSGPHRGGWGVYGPGPLPENRYGSGETQEEAIASFGGHGHNGKVFKSRHWDQPNVLAHIRFNERTDADGKRVLFIEEIQSDWAQDGKKRGFLQFDWRIEKSDDGIFYAWGRDNGEFYGSGRTEAEAIATANAERSAVSNRVPTAPFVTKTDAWVALALKRAISWAASNGFDSVAFINGEQSAERYDLSKQISKVRYEDNSTGGIGRADMGGAPGRGILYAYDHDGNLKIERWLDDPIKELPDLIGKELAEKLLNAESTERRSSAGFGVRKKELSGLDIKVGGEGMRAFYDKIVPSVAKDVLKKLGGEAIKKISIGEGGAYSKHVGLEDGKAVHVFDSRSSAQRWAENGANRTIKPEGQIEQPGFDITDKMRAHAEAGMPLFARNKAGASSTDGKASSIAAAGSGVDQPASAISRKDLDEVIARVSVGWAGFGRSKITVLPTAADLPRAMLDAILAAKVSPKSIEGIEHNGRVYLIQENIRDAKHAETILFHEVYGHIGMRLLGAKRHSVLNGIWADLGGYEGIAKLAKKQKFADGSTVWDRLKPYMEMAGGMSRTEHRSMIVDELIAFMAQRNDTSSMTRFKEYLAQTKDAVVGFLTKHGFKRLASWLDRQGLELDALKLVRDARNAVVTGKMPDGAPIRIVGNQSTTPRMSADRSGEQARPSFSIEQGTKQVEEEVAKGYRQKAKRLLDRVDGVVNGLGNLPDQEQYLGQRYRALGKIARVDEIAKEIRAAFRHASAADKGAVYEYLTTAGADVDGISKVELRDMAIRVKRYIGTVGDELVKRGLLSEEAREEYRDRYLPRMYLAHLLEENDWRAIGAGKKVSDMGYLKQRKDIPEEIRRVILGEVKDPAFLAASAIAKPMRDMALLDWLSQISQNEKWVWPESLVEVGGGKASAFWLKAEAEALRKRARHYTNKADHDTALKVADQMDADATEKIDGLPLNHKEYKQIPNTPRYGRLRGMLVRAEIYDDLMGAQDFLPKDPGWAQQILSFGGYGTKATQLWKMSKVSLNVPGQIRNMISNLVMLQLSGVPLHRFPVVLARSIRNIRANGKYWQIAKKYGVTESTFQAQELFKAKRDLLELERDIRGMTPWLAIKTAAAAITDIAGNAYQASESFVKTAKILHAMEYEGMGEEAAALEAQKWLFDYSLVNRNTRYLRNSPIGMPFLTYQTKVAPRLIEVAALHPWRFLPWVALMYGMQAWAMSAFGGDDDEWKRLKKALPQWMQDKNHIAFLPWRDENGRLQAVDMSYFFPWSQWTEFGGDMAEGELGKAMQAAGLFGGPVTDLIVALETNKDSFTKRDIYAEGDPVEKQAAAVLAYVYDMAVPPMISSRGVASPLWLLDSQYGGKLADAMTGRTNRIGAEKSTVGQAAAAAVGVNAYGIDPEQSRTMNLLQLKNEVDQTKARARSALSNRGLSSIQQKEVAKQYTDELVRRTKKFSDYANESKVPEFAKRRQPADAP